MTNSPRSRYAGPVPGGRAGAVGETHSACESIAKSFSLIRSLASVDVVMPELCRGTEGSL
jgi:hypothetical protein